MGNFLQQLLMQKLLCILNSDLYKMHRRETWVKTYKIWEQAYFQHLFHQIQNKNMQALH